MADPASILGLISASLTITLRAATIGKDIHSLTTKLKGADAKVKQLSVHISAIRVAARSLSTWLEEDVVGSEDVEAVKRDLAEVLSACCDLLSDLQDLVAKALAGAESVGFKGAVRYVWDEEAVKETTELLHHQETALLLMLQALSQIRSSEQRQAKLKEPGTVEVLQKAKRPSSSIFGVNGGSRSSERFSFASESSAKLEEVFTFDMEVMASTAYRNAFTSLLRRNITKRTEALASTGADRDSVLTLKAIDSGPGVDEIEGTIGKTMSSETRIDGKSQENAPSPPTKPADLTKPTANDKSDASTKGYFVRALYDYEADDKTSLSFRQGDMIQVITQLESGWWDGILNGVRGWIPSNHCADIAPTMGTLDLLDLLVTSDEPDDDDDDDDFELIDEDEIDRIKSEESERNEEAAFWIPQATPEGRLYYYNTLTGVSTMELPLRDEPEDSEGPRVRMLEIDDDEDEAIEKQESAPAEEAAFWIPQATPDGSLFYFNTLTGVSTKELPFGGDNEG